MKQGRADKSGPGAQHVEPKSKAVNPEYVAQMGASQGSHATTEGDLPFKTVQMYGGRGLAPPQCKTTLHRGGSQGRH